MENEPPDDPKWFIKLMPTWIKVRAIEDGIDLRSVGLLELIWISIINKEMDGK